MCPGQVVPSPASCGFSEGSCGEVEDQEARWGLRNEMLMKLVAKKAKSADVFFLAAWQGFMDFSPVGLHLLFSLNGPQREKHVNFYASYPLKTQTAGSWKRTVDWLKANLWTDNCSGFYFTTVYVISKCRKCLFVFCNWFRLPPGLEN